MAQARSKLTPRGQTTVPAAVREKLGLEPGSWIEWSAEGQHIVVRKVGKYTFEDIHAALFGTKGPRPRTLAELKRSRAEHGRGKRSR